MARNMGFSLRQIEEMGEAYQYTFFNPEDLADYKPKPTAGTKQVRRTFRSMEVLTQSKGEISGVIRFMTA